MWQCWPLCWYETTVLCCSQIGGIDSSSLDQRSARLRNVSATIVSQSVTLSESPSIMMNTADILTRQAVRYATISIHTTFQCFGSVWLIQTQVMSPILARNPAPRRVGGPFSTALVICISLYLCPVLLGKQCYHCQGVGHVQADCPTLRLSGASTSGVCYSCGQPGHLAVCHRLHSILSLHDSDHMVAGLP